jgi:hypothetical protein
MQRRPSDFSKELLLTGTKNPPQGQYNAFPFRKGLHAMSADTPHARFFIHCGSQD